MSYSTERPTMDELVARNASGIRSMKESSFLFWIKNCKKLFSNLPAGFRYIKYS